MLRCLDIQFLPYLICIIMIWIIVCFTVLIETKTIFRRGINQATCSWLNGGINVYLDVLFFNVKKNSRINIEMTNGFRPTCARTTKLYYLLNTINGRHSWRLIKFDKCKLMKICISLSHIQRSNFHSDIRPT